MLLVSHDRAFLNGVVTSTLAIEPDGQVREYDGGYDDYLRQRSARVAAESRSSTTIDTGASTPAAEEAQEAELQGATRAGSRCRRRSRPSRRRFDGLHEAMADPAFYKRDGAAIAATKSRLAELEQNLAVAYERWEALEGSGD